MCKDLSIAILEERLTNIISKKDEDELMAKFHLEAHIEYKEEARVLQGDINALQESILELKSKRRK